MQYLFFSVFWNKEIMDAFVCQCNRKLTEILSFVIVFRNFFDYRLIFQIHFSKDETLFAKHYFSRFLKIQVRFQI